MAAVSMLIVIGCWFRTEKALMKAFRNDQLSPLFLLMTPFLFGLLGINEPWLILKSGLFICLLYYIGMFDLITYTIPRFSHYLIGVMGLIGIQNQLSQHLLAGLILCLPFLFLYWLQRFLDKCQVGWGDVLYVLSATFYLGLIPGFIGLVVGLMLFIIGGVLTKDYSRGYPLAPALSIGFLVGLLVMF
ncbi:hypothetical protein [Acetobacterium woodii]|uniref:hypothetical protein n=1 Tax=Acetobacterium woodii TaxID=33952 RepID=UPI0002F8673C|nr:hypothetical protein [Acetobacterium woodii]